MRKFEWTGYVPLILFAAFIWGYSLIDVFWPSREYSEMENRYLQQAPAFSARSLFNNTYTIKFEEFTNDQFFLRDSWITLKSLCETALGKIENNGVVYGRDGYMFERRISVDEEQLRKNTDSIMKFAEKFQDKSITLMIVPTSDMILTDKTPRGLHNFDQLSVIDDVYERAAGLGINVVDVYSALSSRNGFGEEEYVYYRTDHHWTTLGAFLAWQEYARTLEASVPGLDENLALNARGLETYSVPGFYGTYYSKCKLFSAIPDTISYCDIPVKSVKINNETVYGLYDHDKFEERDKYAAFLHGNNGVTVIESDRGPNRDGGEKTSVLMFKDSFGNCFAPFLCYGFDEVTVADLRYFTETEKLVREGDYDEILILYGFPSFSEETSVVNLKL